MSIPPDDLPRSRSGRVPQWVIDEAVGRRQGPPRWREWEQPAPAKVEHEHVAGARRKGASWVEVVVAVVAVVIGVGWWAQTGWAGVPNEWVASVNSAIGREEPGLVPDVRALADAAYMTDEGRRVFYGTRPQIVDRAEVAEHCRRTGDDDRGADGDFRIAGCYVGNGFGDGSIYLAEPEDPQLYGYLTTTAAHEMLHAAWEVIGVHEQVALGPILEAELAALDPAHPLHAQIAWSLGDDAAFTRGSEIFASLGAGTWYPGGLDPRLEEVYSRFISDRAGLVATYDAFVG